MPRETTVTEPKEQANEKLPIAVVTEVSKIGKEMAQTKTELDTLIQLCNQATQKIPTVDETVVRAHFSREAIAELDKNGKELKELCQRICAIATTQIARLTQFLKTAAAVRPEMQVRAPTIEKKVGESGAEALKRQLGVQ